MRKKVLILVFGLVFVLGAYSQQRLAPPNDPNVSAGRGQAEIIINASNSDKDIAVWVNGVVIAHVPPKSSEKIIVNNGATLVEAADTTLSRGNWNIGAKKSITVNANSQNGRYWLLQHEQQCYIIAVEDASLEE